jgi:thiamine-monophosphate kinase
MAFRENDLIARLRARIQDPPEVVGIGDDCCVWTPGGPTCLSTDTVVEGRHFRSDDDPSSVGSKAVGAALSDLAAMGAMPRGATAALTCSAAWDANAVMRGVIDACARFNCPLLGGDTTSGDALVLTITVWGEAAKGRLLLRSGGSPGDLLIVTGPLGGSLINGRHLDPLPRLEEGAWLAGHPAIRACMDISDGLAADIRRFAAASNCGAVLLPRQIPVHDDVPAMSDTVAAAMNDGEDYELLVAIAPEHWPSVQLAWPFNDPLCVIGWLTDSGIIQAESNGGRLIDLPYTGFEHSA